MAAPKIDSYRFGAISIDGWHYGHDVIIYPDHVDANWWREAGHTLAPEDLWEVLQAPPEVLVIGQGSMGRMEVPAVTWQQLQAAGIAVIAEPTAQACETYNRLREQRRVVAALHVTC